MLFKQHFIDRIRTEEIDLAFRKWRRPSVKAGGYLFTPAGQLQILSVKKISQSRVRQPDAIRAGFPSLDDLRADLAKQRSGQLYRIQFVRMGADPRITLRNDARINKQELQSLPSRLQSWDRHSRHGDWTQQVLQLIGKYPEKSAGELAQLSGRDKEWLKLNIRKLKNLGLTESLNPGYRLSPRGHAFLKATRKTSMPE